MKEQDFLSIFQMAENFCGRHQIVYCDHHKKMVKLVIEKTLEEIKNSLQVRQNAVATIYDMDIYGGQEPKKEKLID
jgi:hypothetical protein